MAIFIGLLCPSLIQDGMFMDGQQYACVAKNLAHGQGSFWFPHLSDTWWKAGSGSFMEHPPLVYGIQSFFFKILGDGMYVERIYSLVTAIITALLLVKIWRAVFEKDQALKKLNWLAILLWIIIPVNFWSYQNNMQENTMGIFSLAAVYFIIKLFASTDKKWLWLTFSALCIVAAFLSKGPPGLFPLVGIGIYWISFRKVSFARAFLYSLGLLLLVASIFALILLNDAAYESLTFYLNDRLLYRVADEPTVSNRFEILFRLFTELMPSIGFVFLFILISKLKKFKLNVDQIIKQHVIFFSLIGLSASLPLLLTPVQKGFYLVPAFPFFALALGVLIAPFISHLINSAKPKFDKILKISAIVISIVSIGITISQIGNTRRDNAMLADTHLIGAEVPEGSTIYAEQAIFDQWSFQFYLLRYYDISVSVSDNSHPYYIKLMNSAADISTDYVLIPTETTVYQLYLKE